MFEFKDDRLGKIVPLSNNFKVLVFTHNDLDGVGSGLVAEAFFGQENTKVIQNNYTDVAPNMKKVIENKEYEDYDLVIMTDLSIPQQDMDVINQVNDLFGHKFVLLDHHESALWNNKLFDWSKVAVELNGELQSGTVLLYNYLISNRQFFYENGVPTLMGDKLRNVRKFSYLIREYDSWDWSRNGNEYAEDFNAFLYLNRKNFKEFVRSNQYGIEIEPTAYEKIKENKLIFNELVKVKNKEIMPTVFQTDERNYNMGVVYVELGVDTSKMGNELAKLNPKFDGIVLAILETKKVSIRTEKDDVSMIPLAKSYFNGGGHPKACGGMILDIDKFIALVEKNKPKLTINELLDNPLVKNIIVNEKEQLTRLARMKVLLEKYTANEKSNKFENILVHSFGLCIFINENEFFVFNYKGIVYINKKSPKVIITKKYSNAERNDNIAPHTWLSKAIRSNYFGVTDDNYRLLYKIFNEAYDLRVPIKDNNGKSINSSVIQAIAHELGK